MRRWLLFTVAACGLTSVAAPQPVRNPFWPVGYEGKRAVISPVPRVRKAPEPPKVQPKPAAKPAVQEEAKIPTGAATVAEWEMACGQVKVGVVMRARQKGGAERASVIFNGRVCNVGEEVKAVSNHRVFVWRFAGIGEGGVVRLIRVRTEPFVEKPSLERTSKGVFDFFKKSK